MSRRPKRKSELELPDWLVTLIVAEGSESQLRTWRRRIAKTGVVALTCMGPEARPDAIATRGPRFQCRVAITHSSAKPTTHAMVTLVEALAELDDYVRLRLAAADMESVAFCASELAKYRHVPGSLGPVPHSPWASVEDLLEVALVVVYCRSFTGDARLRDSWLPPAGEDRRLHDALMTRRSHVDAHADHTAHRSLVDTTAVLGGDGPPELALAWTQSSAQGLRSVAEMCERQRVRFAAAADEMHQLVLAAIERAGVRMEA